MKKLILSLSVIGLLTFGASSAQAEWSPYYLNPLQYVGIGPNYTHFTLNPFAGFRNCDPCPLPQKCEKPDPCKCKKVKKCDPCKEAKIKPCEKCQKAFDKCDKCTGAAAPIKRNPCDRCIKRY